MIVCGRQGMLLLKPWIWQKWKNINLFHPGSPALRQRLHRFCPVYQSHAHRLPAGGTHISSLSAQISFSLPWSPAIPNTPSVITSMPPASLFFYQCSSAFQLLFRNLPYRCACIHSGGRGAGAGHR